MLLLQEYVNDPCGTLSEYHIGNQKNSLCPKI